jgi:flagellar hook-basal body complex protein FliE
MQIPSNFNINGDIIGLKVSRPNHMTDILPREKSGDPVVQNFADMFNKALGEVNDLELKSTELTNKMTIDPDSVNIHDVQIAAEKAEMAVLFTKGIVDRVIRAYREITELR